MDSFRKSITSCCHLDSSGTSLIALRANVESVGLFGLSDRCEESEGLAPLCLVEILIALLGSIDNLGFGKLL